MATETLTTLFSDSRDAPDIVETVGSILCPPPAHQHHFLRDPGRDLGSLESQGNVEDQGKVRRLCGLNDKRNVNVAHSAEAQRPSRQLWKTPARMFSVFSNKRSRIKDNRDKRLVRRQCKGIIPGVSQVLCENSFAYSTCEPAVEKYPEGYPRISAYIDSDSDTALFRRFSILHARSLLYKQVELTELEAQLDQLDKEDDGEPGADDNKWRLGHSISLAGGKENEKRRDLMKQIDEKLEEYGISPWSTKRADAD
jgi:hypothetical protein